MLAGRRALVRQRRGSLLPAIRFIARWSLRGREARCSSSRWNNARFLILADACRPAQIGASTTAGSQQPNRLPDDWQARYGRSRPLRCSADASCSPTGRSPSYQLLDDIAKAGPGRRSDIHLVLAQLRHAQDGDDSRLAWLALAALPGCDFTPHDSAPRWILTPTGRPNGLRDTERQYPFSGTSPQHRGGGTGDTCATFLVRS